jgi:cell wall-associated NlpC family hydrolase
MRAIGPSLNDAERLALIAAARSYLGVRFRHQGRSERGVDCAGLIVVCLLATGRVPADVEAYGREPLNQGLRGMCVENFGEPIPKGGMQPGDVALMRFRGEPSHVGLVTDYPYDGLALIHAFAQVKKVVEHRLDSEWLGNIVEVFRP